MEIERALRFGRDLTVIAIELGDARQGGLELLSEAIDGRLRSSDLAGTDGDASLFVLLPETTADGARIVAKRLLVRFAPMAPHAKAGVAICPIDGSEVTGLLTSARSAARAMKPGEVGGSTAPRAVRVLDREVIVADPTMSRLFVLAQRVAKSDIPVLVFGESGVGKEILAQALHAWSRRADRPFVVINCAALPETLVESELFGYERGAFSGAMTAKPGLLESASGGTVLLDEVSELNAVAQAKLLRVIESKRVHRLGAIGEVEIDVRILSASNRDLEAEVKAGRFRLDLFHRLSGARLFIPPLRERTQDLALLARKLLEDACARGGRPPMEISPRAMEMLMRHSWPGNVRELKNVIELIAVTLTGPMLEPEALPLVFGMAAADSSDVVLGSSPMSSAAAGPAPPAKFRNLYEEIHELERVRLCEALAATGGVKNRAAELIGVPLRTFIAKLNRYQIFAAPGEAQDETS